MVFLFNHDWQWMWVRLVMFDLWMLLVLGPAAWTWMPQTSSVKSAPLASEAELEMGMFGTAGTIVHARQPRYDLLTLGHDQADWQAASRDGEDLDWM